MVNNTKNIKSRIRQEIRAKRNNLTQADVAEKSLAICRHIINHRHFKLAHSLGIYLAHGKEVKLNYLLQEAIRLNKDCYAPVINYPRAIDPRAIDPAPKMSFNQVTSLPSPVGKGRGNLWRNNIYGIKEPYQTTSIALTNMDVIFVPLVAFDKSGARLGMGGGYYDATFQFCRPDKQGFVKRPKLIGVAYELQRIDAVPIEAQDIKLNELVTEKGWLELQ